ncbi:NifX-associated nitrogen fixation protein [Halioxenophilus sp. WMMB6]|uniref:NifX-associated nitrogen fixation protein n=1 Tax=Halioxenophilus sp. WMMB6 TaxID=3073815 RepID=UPI00295EB31D|nr:NifX-associated nitrogen fixation protein [Halioxenophilus sp. WMMB6]
MSEAVEISESVMEHPFVRQMVIQLRAMDSYGTYDNWSDEKVINPLVLTKERKREIPVVGDPDEVIVARLKAYYNALSSLIEKECGLMAVPVVNLTHEGFGRAFIVVGKLIAMDKTLRDVHRFGFPTMEKMIEEGEKIVSKAAGLVNEHRTVAEL